MSYKCIVENRQWHIEIISRATWYLANGTQTSHDSKLFIVFLSDRTLEMRWDEARIRYYGNGISEAGNGIKR